MNGSHMKVYRSQRIELKADEQKRKPPKKTRPPPLIYALTMDIEAVHQRQGKLPFVKAYGDMKKREIKEILKDLRHRNERLAKS